MPDLPVCLASIPFGDDTGGSIGTVAGVDAILLTDVPFFDDAALGRLHSASLPIVLDIDPTRFPLDHPLVAEHPEAFVIRRSATDVATIDPRRPMPAAGEAMARMRIDDFGALLVPLLARRIGDLAERGAAGIRIAHADRIAPGLLGALVADIRRTSPDLLLLAGISSPSDRYGEAGFDAITAPYIAGSYRDTMPLLAEVLGSDAANLEMAAVGTDGLIVPAGLAGPAVARASDLARRARRYSRATRRLTGPGARVTALLRADHADLRSAGHVLLALVNRDDEARPAPGIASLIEAAGSGYTTFHVLDGSAGSDPFADLAGREVRLLVAVQLDPIGSRWMEEAGRAADHPRLVVEAVGPSVSGGDFAVKRVVGEIVHVTATIYTDGHEQLAAELLWRADDEPSWSRVPMVPGVNDSWRAEFPLERVGRYRFVVEGWIDRFGGFQRDFGKKLDADVAMPVDHSEGHALIEEAVRRGGDPALKAMLSRLGAADEAESAALLLSDEARALMEAADPRPHALRSPEQRVDSERLQARFSSWYELFPRSMTDDKARHGTFDDVIARMPAVRAMGFDTLYFPPIHPIGHAFRKGPNNTLMPGPDDVGSPYAIGDEAGGHDAIHPDLGDFDDFRRLVATARDHGLEIALDFAIQASPDHPWLTEHPGWFAWRPDGSMKYAENPPKKYQDIVNVDFYGPDAVPDLWVALRDVVLLWVDNGVKTFRVDNPHTKPLPFWEWMIGDVRARHPDVIFLAEAFTRPTMMYRLAKIGFSQSYTYFTWRDRKHELIEYITELTTTEPREFYRPHFFVNTPDINPIFLQTSGRPGFRIRAVLAATLSGLFGVYSGFELCESAPMPGKEEYLDSEKYEIRPRDYRTPGNIIADITMLNRLRRDYPALQTHLNTRFYSAQDDNIIYYGKPAADGSDMILVMVNLDPHHAHDCAFEVPLWEFGMGDDGSVAVEDLAAGHRFRWYGKTQTIRLAPDEPYRIWRIAPGEGA